MNLQDLVFFFILPVLSVAMLFVFFRLVRGPSLPDRVVAFDLMGTLVIGIIAAYSVATGQSAYLDVAVTVALIAFLGTVAFAYYIQRGRANERHPDHGDDG